MADLCLDEQSLLPDAFIDSYKDLFSTLLMMRAMHVMLHFLANWKISF